MMREISRCLKWGCRSTSSWDTCLVGSGEGPLQASQTSGRKRALGGLDVAGTDDVEDKRYLLVATYTWPQVNVEDAEVLPEGRREGDDPAHLPDPVGESPEEEDAEVSLEVEERASREVEEPIIPEREDPGPLKTLYFTVPLRRRRCWAAGEPAPLGPGGRIYVSRIGRVVPGEGHQESASVPGPEAGERKSQSSGGGAEVGHEENFPHDEVVQRRVG